MKKIFWITALLISTLMLLSGCSSYVLAQDKTTAISPFLSTPIPPESIASDQKSVSYYFVGKEDLAQVGIVPRDLTQPEQEIVIKIGLGISLIREKMNLGYSYRTKLAWASYNPGSTIEWSYCDYDNKEQLLQSNVNYSRFPALEIGLGTPQQFNAYVAIDLHAEKAVYATIIPDGHVIAPPIVKPLTEYEKATLVAIASESDAVKTRMSDYHAVDFQWVGISQSGGTAYGMNYDAIEKGIPAYVPLKSESITIYPSVLFKSKDWIVSVAIDLQNAKIMYIYSHPTR
jgi:hypothetical protein